MRVAAARVREHEQWRVLELGVLKSQVHRCVARQGRRQRVSELAVHGDTDGCDDAWLQANPLTVADLEREVGYLRSVGYDLSFN